MAALFPLAGILPALSDGIIRTADGPIHLHRIYAMTLLMRQGDLWPRWTPYFHLGYGYPAFNFYPPGVHWLGGLLGLVGLSAPVAFNLLMAASWIAGTLGAYALARRFLPGKCALLAAMVWAYAPSRLHEVWSQGSLPQMAAAAIVPWFFLAIALAWGQPSRRHAAALGLSLAALPLLHLPVAFLSVLFAAPLIGIAVIWTAVRHRARLVPALACLIGGLALGAGLAAIFVLPMAAELPLIDAAQTGYGAEYLSSGWMTPADLVIAPQPLDLTDLRLDMPSSLGPLAVGLGAAGMLALLWRRRWGLAALLGLGLAATFFLTQPASEPVWLNLPYMTQLRFPNRVLRVGIVPLALAGGASLLLLPERWRTAGLGAGLALVLLGSLPWTYPARDFLRWDSLSAADEIQMELDDHVWGTTSYNEFQPVWGETIPLDGPDTATYASAPLQIGVYGLDLIQQYPDLVAEQVADQAVRVTVTSPRPVRFRQFYYPGWTATIDDQPAEVYPEEERGLITVDVPAGEHTIRLHYAGTPVQTAGGLITLACLILTGVLIATGRGASETPEVAPAAHRLAPALGAGALIAGLINGLLIAPHTTWLRVQSPPDAPAAMRTPVHATFGGVYELLGYSLTQEAVSPGGTLDIMLYWRPLREEDRVFVPVVQLINLTRSEAWAVSLDRGQRYANYPTDRFTSDAVRLAVFEGIPPYAGQIKVQLIDLASGEPLRLADGADFLLLEPLIRVQGSNPAPARTMDYVLGESVRLVCASARWETGELGLDLAWQVDAPLAEDVSIFIHLLNPQGRLVDQHDSQPFSGNYPAHLWQPGQLLADRYELPFRPSFASLEIGLYTPGNGDRLSVTSGGQPVVNNLIPIPIGGAPCWEE